MDPSQAERDARVERILGELDDLETKIEELHPASRVRGMLIVLAALLVTVGTILAFLMVPGIWDLSPFLLAAVGYAAFGWFSLSAKNEKLAELKEERVRLTRGRSG